MTNKPFTYDNDGITRFVVLFEGRTGSSYVMHALDSHPNIIARGEMLVKISEQHQHQRIYDLYQKDCIETPNTQAVGFKTKLRDVKNPEEFATILQNHNVKIVMMFRKNLVKLALSRLNAQRLFKATGTWNSTNKTDALAPLEVAPEEFNEALEFRKQKDSDLRNWVKDNFDHLPTSRLTLYYEDLLIKPEQFFSSIFTYLHTPPSILESPLKKTTPDNMRKALVNYDEIKSYYDNTPYAYMFD